MTLRAARRLPVSVDPVVEDVVRTFELRLGYRTSFERHGRDALCYMTQRKRLDEFLARAAEDAGATFRDGVRVDPARVNADVVIAADGANGTTARALGLGQGIDHGVALEGNLSYGAVEKKRYRGRLVLELGAVPGGYTWVFPKGDHVNVGVGGWRSEGPRLRAHLQRLCKAHGFDFGRVTDLRGYRLPYRARETQIARGRALLVGDAAGLIDPLTGDGMYEAITSANLAAEAVLAGDLAAYPAAVARTIDPLTNAGWAAKRALDRFPRTVFALTRLPVTWRAVEKLVAGETLHPGAARGTERGALKLIELVARAA